MRAKAGARAGQAAALLTLDPVAGRELARARPTAKKSTAPRRKPVLAGIFSVLCWSEKNLRSIPPAQGALFPLLNGRHCSVFFTPR